MRWSPLLTTDLTYGMLKNNAPFNPEIDLGNRERFSDKPHKGKKDKSRRCQDFVRVHRYRGGKGRTEGERKLSQNAVSAECGICASVPESSSWSAIHGKPGTGNRRCYSTCR